MIKTNKTYTKGLFIKLKVLNVEWEPHAASTWLVQYKDYPPIQLDEIGFKTLAEDKNLVGTEIEAQLYLNDSKVIHSAKKDKTMKLNNGRIVFTGKFEDIIKYFDKNKIINTYILDSILPIEIGSIPLTARVGDWLSAEGEGNIVLLR